MALADRSEAHRLARLQGAATSPRAGRSVDGDLNKKGSVNDLITKDEYGDFELEWEWKLPPGGNAGVFYRGNESAEKIYWTAPEYQLLDDAGHADGKSRLTSAGSAYALYPSPAAHVKRGRRVEQLAHRRARRRTSSTGSTA